MRETDRQTDGQVAALLNALLPYGVFLPYTLPRDALQCMSPFCLVLTCNSRISISYLLTVFDSLFRYFIFFPHDKYKLTNHESFDESAFL